MKRKSKRLTLPCDCKCCVFVVEKTAWEDGDISYNISIKDSRYVHNCNTVWRRMKRAASILFGDPYSVAYLEGEERFKNLVADMDNLAKSVFGKGDA